MKILQILPELNIGGVERGTLDLARELQAKAHQALVVSNGGILVKELQASGARHIRLNVDKKNLFTILFNIPRLAKILQEEKVDVVHARSRIPALIAFLACRRTGVDFITTCHGYYSRHFFSRVMGWGKYVIVSSNVIAQHMIKDFAVPQERIRFIPRGVNLEEFEFQQRKQEKDYKKDAFTIGVIGRLTPIKGQRYFLQALAKVIRLVPRVRALIVGDVSPGKEKYKEELMMLTRRLSLDRYVEFLGREDNIPRILSRLDILVLPTVTAEAFGRVLIEAAACGVPVIASRIGGIVDIIEEGKNGILVQPRDSLGLASAIIRLIREPQLRQQLVSVGRKKVEQNFTLKQMAANTIRLYEQAQENKRILVIKLSALGDVILALPSLKALRKRFPQAYIAVLVASPFRSILEDCPYINQVIELPQGARGYRALWRTSALLRKLCFDIVVDLQNNRRSHMLAYLSTSSRRYGYANGKFSFLLNKRVKRINTPLSPIKHQMRALRLLNINDLREKLELWPKEQDKTWAKSFLAENKSNKNKALIGISPTASLAWVSKRWPIEKFAALIDRLYDAGMEVMVTGKASERRLNDRLKGLCQYSFIDAVGKTSLLELACLVNLCAVYVTGDSALLHIAYAMKTPVVALFGPTDPRRHTIAFSHQVVIRKDVDCSPCYKRNCREHSCMEEITVDEVFGAIKKLLDMGSEKQK